MKKHTPKLILLASAVAVAGMFAISTIGSGSNAYNAATNDGSAPLNDPARVVAKKGGKKKKGGGQGDEHSTAKGDNGQGVDRSAAKGDNGGGGKKHGKKKKK
jgi:hypothetical protein